MKPGLVVKRMICGSPSRIETLPESLRLSPNTVSPEKGLGVAAPAAVAANSDPASALAAIKVRIIKPLSPSLIVALVSRA